MEVHAKQDANVITVMCCDTVNRGLAYGDGKLFLHQADAALTAIDAKTGKLVWTVADGDPKKGETGTSAPLVVKDKVIVGTSGGEFGVRAHLTAYDTATGKQIWRAYSVGPDAEILFDAEKTTSLGKPVGKDSSVKTWTGDQWKIGGGAPWGWLSYDPDLNLIFHGTGNPSTWNPAQRASADGKQIDQKWTTSVIARNADTGVASWAYQFTPFDEWDYDGINEMILTDLDVKGKKTPALVHFDRSGFGYTLNRATGELLVAEKFDPTVNWATGVVMDKADPRYGRPNVDPKYSTFLNGPMSTRAASAPRRSAQRVPHLRAIRRRRSSSTSPPTKSAWTMSRSRSPTHPDSPTSARPSTCTRHPAHTAAWVTSQLGMRLQARSSGRSPSSSPYGQARSRQPATSSSTEHSKAI